MGILLIALTFALTACSLTPFNRHSSHEAASHSTTTESENSPFHTLTGWSQTIDFYLSHRASDEIIDASEEAAKSWNKAIGWDLLRFAGVIAGERERTLYGSLEDEITVIYVEDEWRASTGKSDLTLATTVWENDGASDRIVKGDIILNAENYLFVDANQKLGAEVEAASIVDAESVLLHEFGHLIGLDHVEVTSDPESVMHAKTYIGPQMTSRILSNLDRENIRTLYP